MWNNNYGAKYYLESKTENGFIVFTVLYNDHFSEDKKPRYDTLVFRSKRNGEPDIDRCLESKVSHTEDEAYMCHMMLWEKHNRGNND